MQISKKKNMRLFSLCFLILSMMSLVGCSHSQTIGIYNEWLCTNNSGPRFIISEEGMNYQYNNQRNSDINYFSGEHVEIKNGEEAKRELAEASNDGAVEFLSNPEHIYSVHFYFTNYIDAKGINQSHLIQENESWWYAFKLVGNGMAQVINIHTGEEFYCEVVQ